MAKLKINRADAIRVYKNNLVKQKNKAKEDYQKLSATQKYELRKKKNTS
jgi:hypothetical protein